MRVSSQQLHSSRSETCVGIASVDWFITSEQRRIGTLHLDTRRDRVDEHM